MAELLCFYFLEQGWIYRYSDLLEMISKKPEQFWGFHDSYFMNLIHQRYLDGSLKKDPAMRDIAETLLFARIARHVRCPEFRQRLLEQDDQKATAMAYKKAQDKVDEIKAILEKKGKKSDWMIVDLPKKRNYLCKIASIHCL